MRRTRRWQRLRIAVPLALIIMVLMRLVWMQLRAYPVVSDARAQIAWDVAHHVERDGCLASGETRLVEPAPTFQSRAQERLASPSYVAFGALLCGGELLTDRRAVRINQWLFVATVLMATMMTRFMTSSWTVALIVAAMLFSRGHLLGEIGNASSDAPITLLLTAWAASSAHFLRTAATGSLVAAVLAATAAAFFDRSLLALSLAMPVLLCLGFAARRYLARPVIRKMRGTSRRLRVLYGAGAARPPSWPVEDSESAVGRVARSMRWVFGMEFPPAELGRPWRPSYARGSLFRPIEVPFLLWALGGRRWLRLAGLWFGVALLTALALAVWQWGVFGDGFGPSALTLPTRSWSELQGQLALWWGEFSDHFDLHLSISVIVILLCASQSPAAGLSSFLEGVWLVLITALLLLVGGFLADSGDQRLVLAALQTSGPESLLAAVGPRPVISWLEPTILSLGIAGIYNLMKVLDTRIAERS